MEDHPAKSSSDRGLSLARISSVKWHTDVTEAETNRNLPKGVEFGVKLEPVHVIIQFTCFCICLLNVRLFFFIFCDVLFNCFLLVY